MKPLRWRILFVLALTAFSAYVVAPTIIYFSMPKEIRNDEDQFEAAVPSWLPQSHAKLGLDLLGGVQLLLGVDTRGAIDGRLNRTAVEVTRWAEDAKIAIETAYVVAGSQTMVVELGADEDVGRFNEQLHGEFPLLEKRDRDEQKITYGYKDSEVDRIEKSALEQANRVIRNRVDRWGVTEPVINQRADGSILVQMPGFTDPEKAKELLGRTAQLEFKIVDDTFTGFDKLRDQVPEGITATDNGGQTAFVGEERDDLIDFLKSSVPDDRELVFMRQQLGQGDSTTYRWTSYVVFARTELTGEDILDANLGQGQTFDRRPVVSLRFSGAGGRRFAEVTGRNVRKRLAIVLDKVVESDPVIQQRITGGGATITLGGGRSYNEIVEEGTQLALILKSGAVPAAITVLEQRQVGASLGPELANQGIKGILFGLGLVLLFMLLYYRRPGVIACLALTLNAVFLLSAMASFGFALTLPGIAGFILTLGMAVDANVLINERIRQEIREGKHPRKSVHVGFQKAFWTIMDGNITTLIAALVLLETTGSGPIRGFAISLMIGLLVSLFTSLYCSRLFFDVALTWIPDSKIKVWLGVKNERPFGKLNFLRLSRPVTGIILAICAAVIVMTAVRGVDFGVDFVGGTQAQVAFSKPIEADEIRDVAEEAGIDGLSVQSLEGGHTQYLLRYDEGKEEAEAEGQHAAASDTFLNFKKALLEGLADYKPEILQVEFIGPQVGAELRNQGIISVIYALLAVLIYIAFRFDMRFAPGAVVKMVLDIIVMLGFYVFFDASFDLVAVAAFLTVVGYAVNDTIVIYDRIRENIGDHPRRALPDNINAALNETLGRSINTSFTTIASLGGILLFADGQIWFFAMAMAIGVVVATISSTFVAPLMVIYLEKWRSERAAAQAASGTPRKARA